MSAEAQTQIVSVEDIFNDLHNPQEIGNNVNEGQEQNTDEQQPQPVATPPQEEQKVSVYTSKIQELISDGLMEDAPIVLDDGTEVLLSEMDIKDEKLYKQIIKQYKEAEKNAGKENLISLEGLDDITKSIIEVKQKGGSLLDVIKQEVNNYEYLQNLKKSVDDDVQLQIRIVGDELSRKGIKENIINLQIQNLIDSNELDIEANNILDRDLEVITSQIEDKKQEQLKSIEAEREAQKTFKTNLSAKYKEWGISDNIKKVLIENATKQDETGLTNTDKLYFNADPETFAKINFLLNNPTAFEDFISHKKVLKAKNEATISSFRVNLNTTKKEVKSDNVLDELHSK